uniref:Uncharacterized protein n=1 Tax=Glossina morsitans morsitans TaxID=37546 RepID=A0A1B0G344_GLOMM
MEEASKAKKAKKGFMTPERKKKLRLLLRKKAAEELKKEQERKAAERRRIIEERCGSPRNLSDASEEQLKSLCKQYHDRICKLEDQKYDLEYVVKRKDVEKTTSLGALKKICQDYYDKILKLEDQKYDLEYEVARKDLEASILFLKPSFIIFFLLKSKEKYIIIFLTIFLIIGDHMPYTHISELQTICKEYWNRLYKLEGDKFDLEHIQKIKAQESTFHKKPNIQLNFPGELQEICEEYFDRMYQCESQKWDLEYEVRKKDWEINDLNAQVNDLRGKFVKPALKKVSKYENKFAKLQKKAAEFNFRNQLKVVKKKEFTLEEEEKEKKPDWSKGKPGDAKEHAPETPA